MHTNETQSYNGTNIIYITESCLTSYSGRFNLNKSQIFPLIVIDLLLMAMNLLANSLVILSLVLSKKLHNCSLKLILYLSISDCCLACVTQPLFASLLIKFSDVPNCDFEAIVQFFGIFFTHTSGYIIALIGFDRYARVKYAANYYTIMTGFRLKVMVLTMVVLSFAQAMMYVLGTKFDFFEISKRIAVFVDFLIASSVLVVYILAVRAVRSYKINSVNRGILQVADNKVTLVASRILLTIVLFYLAYVAIALTHSIMHQKLTGIPKKVLDFMLLFSYMLAYANSFTNAVIFLSFNKRLIHKVSFDDA